MNWYSVFYWVTVADSVKSVLTVLSIIFGVFSVLAGIGVFVSQYNMGAEASTGSEANETSDFKIWSYWTKTWRRTLTLVLIPTIIMLLSNVFIPSKKDSLIIIAGGTVGNFITKDTSARQIPAEVMNLLRTKIKSEINEINSATITDTLANKTADELREIIKQQKGN